MQAALALPILVLPARAAAAEVGEVGLNVLGYKERGLMKVTEPVLWGRIQLAEVWEIEASGAIDIITGASPQLVTNISGKPVQSVTGASINDRRTTGNVKVTRRFGDYALAASTGHSNEEDYHSKSFGLEARWDLNQRNTTLVASYAESHDHVGSSIDPTLNSPRDTHEYLFGVTQILSPVDIVQSTRHRRARPRRLQRSVQAHAHLLSGPDPAHAAAGYAPRPSRHVRVAHALPPPLPEAHGTLQAEYRFFHDDWGIRAHTLEAGWQHEAERALGGAPGVALLHPGCRRLLLSDDTQAAARDPVERPAAGRLGRAVAIAARHRGAARAPGKSRAPRATCTTLAAFRLGGDGSEAFETLRAVYGLLTESVAHVLTAVALHRFTFRAMAAENEVQVHATDRAISPRPWPRAPSPR